MWTWKELKCGYLPRVSLPGTTSGTFQDFFFWDGLFLLYGCDTAVTWQCVLFSFYLATFYKRFSILLQTPSKPVLTSV